MQETKVGYRYSLEGELNELIINKIKSECRLIVGGGVLFLERCDCSARLIKSLFLLNRLFREFFMYLHQLKNDIAVLTDVLPGSVRSKATEFFGSSWISIFPIGVFAVSFLLYLLSLIHI